MSTGHRQFWSFYALTFLLLALVPGLSALLGTSMDFGAIAERASAETGVPWTSNLWDVVRLCLAEPGLWLLVLGSAVPSLAALCVLASARETAAWRAFGSRLSPLGSRAQPLPSALWSYALLVGSMLACLLGVFVLRGWVSPGEYQQPDGLWTWSLLSTLVFAALLDQGAVLEEAGWRGFAVPVLQDRVRLDPLRAALLVGIAWGLWHVPRDIVIGLPDRLGAAMYLFLYLPAFTLGTVTTSIAASYFMNRIGGSLIPAIMVHGLTNDAMGLAGMATIDRALTPDHQLTKALPFLVLAIILVAWEGRKLGQQSVQGETPI
jgi:hypothetical protein